MSSILKGPITGMCGGLATASSFVAMHFGAHCIQRIQNTEEVAKPALLILSAAATATASYSALKKMSKYLDRTDGVATFNRSVSVTMSFYLGCLGYFFSESEETEFISSVAMGSVGVGLMAGCLNKALRYLQHQIAVPGNIRDAVYANSPTAVVLSDIDFIA